MRFGNQAAGHFKQGRAAASKLDAERRTVVRRRTLRSPASVLALAAALAVSGSAQAATRVWNWAGTGNWSDASSWIGHVLPVNGDDVQIGATPIAALPVSVNFNASYSGAGLGTLTIDAVAGGTASLNQSSPSSAMVAQSENIGQTSLANYYNQSAGTNVAGSVVLGNGPGGGTYNLIGGSLQAGQIAVLNSKNYFNQTGGTITTDTYYCVTFSNGGCTQSGGTLSVSASGALYIDGNGQYTLSGSGQIVSTGSEAVGGWGVAGGNANSFAQSGGSNTTQTLAVGLNDAGIYTLSAGSLQVLGTTTVGGGATGTFVQSGGSASLGADLILAGNGSAFTLGDSDGPSSLSVAGTLHVGSSGAGTFTQLGGSLTATTLSVGESAAASTYSQQGGVATVGAVWVGTAGTGTVNLSGGSLNAQTLQVGSSGGSGTVNHSGSASASFASLVVGAAGSTGSYNLSGGTLAAGTASIASGGSFVHSGGDASFDSLSLDGGSYQLSGGTLTATAFAVHAGNTFTMSGGSYPGTMTNEGTVV